MDEENAASLPIHHVIYLSIYSVVLFSHEGERNSAIWQGNMDEPQGYYPN